jgi:hypothetical protein
MVGPKYLTRHLNKYYMNKLYLYTIAEFSFILQARGNDYVCSTVEFLNEIGNRVENVF